MKKWVIKWYAKEERKTLAKFRMCTNIQDAWLKIEILSLYYLRCAKGLSIGAHSSILFLYLYTHICNKTKIYWKSINQNLYSFYFPLKISLSFIGLKENQTNEEKCWVGNSEKCFKEQDETECIPNDTHKCRSMHAHAYGQTHTTDAPKHAEINRINKFHRVIWYAHA